MSKENPSQLEKLLLDGVESNTPEDIKTDKIFDYDNKNKFTFTLTKDLVEKLELKKWFDSYKKEAMVSTAGIRGPQNVLYPHDTRFPINTIGITLATLAKALVLKEKYPNDELIKLVGCEVRYNSKTYLDIIARIQSALGIRTLTPLNRQTIPIWLASFLAFKLDLVGAEYITSSHGISVKNATKDLNNQGSQFLPDESIEFVNKIEEILNTVDKNGEYRIDFEASENDLIDEKTMQKLNNGIDLYVEYLKNGVANQKNIELIKNFDKKIVIDAVGGAAYNTLSKILEKLGIQKNFDWLNTQEDPFFHSIGKDIKDGKFYDWSLDITVVAKNKEGREYFPVVESLKYDEKLKNYPIGTVCLVTDPDHDRLSVVQIEDIKNKAKVNAVGVDTIELDNERILCVFSANQAFLMLFDFWAKQLKKENLWDKHPRFMIKTTASALSWDEWAANNNVKVVNVPVGFKEIANIMKKVELKLKNNPEKEVIIDDVFGNPVNLGINPRLLFGGEESGGMIMGTEDLIESLHGRHAIAMREKSATEAIIVASALISDLSESKTLLSQYLYRVFEDNKIIGRFDTRVDIAYYNESEPDIEKLKLSKIAGEAMRTKNDMFYLSLAIANKNKKISLDDIKKILNDKFNSDGLKFDSLKSIKFVGDGTYLEFADKYIEIRPSGTDAKTKAYGGGMNKADIEKFAAILGNYSGERTPLHCSLISKDDYENCKAKAMEDYLAFVDKDANNEPFVIPEYDF